MQGHQFFASYAHYGARGLGYHAQVVHARMGAAMGIIYSDELGNETGRDHIRYRFDHLGLAIGPCYRSPGRAHVVLQAGVMPTTLVKAQVRQPDPLWSNDVVVTDLTAKAKNPVIFGYGAFGGAVDLNAPFTVGLLVRYDHGLTTLSRSDFFDTESIIETSWTVSLSLTYRWPQ